MPRDPQRESRLRGTLPVPKDYSPKERRSYFAGFLAGNNHAKVDVQELIEYARESVAEAEARNDVVPPVKNFNS